MYIFLLFNFGCAGSSLLLQVFSGCGEGVALELRCSRCSGFYYGRARAPGAWASVVVAGGLSSCSCQALDLRNCGTHARLLPGMWGLPGPGLEHVSCIISRKILYHRATREVILILFPFFF